MTTEMPLNLIQGQEEETPEQLAAKEAQWLEENVPAQRLELKWRYCKSEIQLFDRRLRSLTNYNVGPALRSYLRTRLEWFKDNRMREYPEGVVVVVVETNGDVDMYLEPAPEIPVFDEQGLLWKDEILAGCKHDGEVFVFTGNAVFVAPGACKDATQGLAVDLLGTLGYDFADGVLTREILSTENDVEICCVSDEFGCIPCQNHEGDFTRKLQSCFNKMWGI